ncbi:MAG: DUF1844 domain-containing protein [Planctomycetaceae bacterium]|nr:DUF1844 domain-containing protein [Planctomycetaceae bacterium]
MAEDKQEKKIIIDEDWKVQAQKERETLKQQEEEAANQAAHEMPPADFMGLVSMLATQAFYALGLIRPEDQKDQHIEPDFVMAKFHIDMLTVLEEKTKGNLNADEAQVLKSSLDQLRMLFVQLSSKV